MPMITNPINYTRESSEIIKEALGHADFDHNCWGRDELQDVRREIRNHYRREQRLKCAYCQNPITAISASGAHIEHIVPKSQHTQFAFEPKNLCVICPDCNEVKRNRSVTYTPLKNSQPKRYPRSSSAFMIVHPHFDDYDDHIIKANRIYIDRTLKGHWTIGACALNRFYHTFGMCEELVEDLDLIQMEEDIHL